jgi:hypothetical protein
MNRYIWRGQSWGGNYFVVQPTIEYELNKKITIGVWGTTNFKQDYFYPDGLNSYKGYQEMDLYINYKVNKYLSFQLWDYYWPSVEKVEGVNNSFFNYGNNGVKTIDFIVLLDFSNVWKPLNVTISTLIAGNDFRYNKEGKDPKQNYTTYLEFGYTFQNILKNYCKLSQSIDYIPVVGMVFNNQSSYYSAGDYNSVSLVNLGSKLSKDIQIDKKITMPLYFTFTHNASKQNTEFYGRNFFIAGISFKYK